MGVAGVLEGPQVIVVGAGPCGLTTANLLGHAGISTLVVEQGEDLLSLPRAVSVDDESMRTLQAAGLQGDASKIVVPGTGTKYFGRRGDICLGYARGPGVYPYGHPPKNPIDQPEFDRMLLKGLDRFPHVDVRFRTRLEGLDALADGVVARLDDGAGVRAVETAYVLGCDGGRSTVRELLGVQMLGDSWPDEWIVIDTINDPHRERYAMHHGDPHRPFVIVPGRAGRCRYEFRVLPGEQLGEAVPLEFIQFLLREYRPTISSEDIVRSIIYQFHAIVAERWRQGPVFLMGDAAHMMPPFAGQGLNSAIRDAHNLVWKLAAVLSGRMDDAILDTYEEERRPHAQAMIRLSQRLGALVMTSSPVRAAVRDSLFVAASRIPWVRRYIEEMRFKPPPRITSRLMDRLAAQDHRLNGQLLPQAYVLRHDMSRVLLDEALGPSFAVVIVGQATGGIDTARNPLWAQLGARVIGLGLGDVSPARGAGEIEYVADADGALTAALADADGKALVVRPDRFVTSVFSVGEEDALTGAFREVLGPQALPAAATLQV